MKKFYVPFDIDIDVENRLEKWLISLPDELWRWTDKQQYLVIEDEDLAILFKLLFPLMKTYFVPLDGTTNKEEDEMLEWLCTLEKDSYFWKDGAPDDAELITFVNDADAITFKLKFGFIVDR